jgi:hypothetical protein
MMISNDEIAHIFSFLTLPTLYNCLQVNKHWNTIIDCESFFYQIASCHYQVTQKDKQIDNTWKQLVKNLTGYKFSERLKQQNVSLSENRKIATAKGSFAPVALHRPVSKRGTTTVTFELLNGISSTGYTLIGAIRSNMIPDPLNTLAGTYLGNLQKNSVGTYNEFNIGLSDNGYFCYQNQIVHNDSFVYHQEGTKITIQINLTDPVPEALLKKKQDYLRYSVGQQYVLGEYTDEKQGTGWIKYYINGKMLEPQVYGFYLEENNNDIYIMIQLTTGLSVRIVPELQ